MVYYPECTIHMLNFKEIMSNSKPKLLNKFSKYTYLAFDIREEYVKRKLLQYAPWNFDTLTIDITYISFQQI